jgi:putative hydrolase of the HAD superfamily
MIRPDTVVFDFGGVLVRWAPGEVVQRLYSDPKLRETLMHSVFQHPDWLEYDRGSFSDEELAARFAERTGLTLEAMHELLREVRESLTPLAATVTLLQDLARRGIPLYGLTNMHGNTFRFLKSRDDFWGVFRGVVVSGDIKLVKPDPRIFAHLLAEHSLKAERVVFLDDSPANVAAARQAGLQAIHFTEAVAVAPQLYALLGISADAA